MLCVVCCGSHATGSKLTGSCCVDKVDMATPKRGILAQPSSGSASQSACKRKRVIFNTVDIAEDSSSDNSMDVTATVRHLVKFGVLSCFGFIHFFSEDDAGRY